MRERCPLEGMKWDEDIPMVCQESCRGIWEEAAVTAQPDVDVFDQSCRHEVEYGGEAIQRPFSKKDNRRSYGIVSICADDGREVFSVTYPFICGNE